MRVPLLVAALAACLLALAGAPTAAEPAAAAAPLPPLPAWARGPSYRGTGQWKDFSIRQNNQNKDVVKAGDASGQPFDFLLYGDSITQLIFRESKVEWAKQFPPARGWRAAPLGVSGNDLEDLAWRLIGGTEAPKLAPKVVGLLIGSNNLAAGTPLDRIEMMYDYIVKWLKAKYPTTTKLLFINILPRDGYNVKPVNRRLKALAAGHGATWNTCGQYLDAADKAVLYDGTHPTVPTQTTILRCLAPTVTRLAGKGPKPPPPPPRRPPPPPPRRSPPPSPRRRPPPPPRKRSA